MKKILNLSILIILITSCKTNKDKSFRIIEKDKLPNYYLILVKIDTIEINNKKEVNYYFKKLPKSSITKFN
jgi:hypothetical protein